MRNKANSPTRQRQGRPSAAPTGPILRNKANSPGPAETGGAASGTPVAGFCETKPISARGREGTRAGKGGNVAAAGSNRAKQSQFGRSVMVGQVLYNKRAMMNLAAKGARQNKANFRPVRPPATTETAMAERNEKRRKKRGRGRTGPPGSSLFRLLSFLSAPFSCLVSTGSFGTDCAKQSQFRPDRQGPASRPAKRLWTPIVRNKANSPRPAETGRAVGGTRVGAIVRNKANARSGTGTGENWQGRKRSRRSKQLCETNPIRTEHNGGTSALR